MTAKYVTAEELLPTWEKDIRSGKPPTLYPVGTAGTDLARIEVGPGLVTLIGGAPGMGKTALVMQLLFDALGLSPSLRAVVCNVEMSSKALLERQLARYSDIDLKTIRHRRFTPEHHDRLSVGMAKVRELSPRLAFVNHPYSVDNIAHTADKFNANLVLIDYVQRIKPPGEHANNKSSVDAVMSSARGFAECGVAVVLVSAVGRSKDNKGKSGYTDLNLASFRESSELEYGADDAFILNRESEGCDVTLHHLKSRNGETCDIILRFAGAFQRFEQSTSGPLAASAKALWPSAEGGEW